MGTEWVNITMNTRLTSNPATTCVICGASISKCPKQTPRIMKGNLNTTESGSESRCHGYNIRYAHRPHAKGAIEWTKLYVNIYEYLVWVRARYSTNNRYYLLTWHTDEPESHGAVVKQERSTIKINYHASFSYLVKPTRCTHLGLGVYCRTKIRRTFCKLAIRVS